MTVPSFRPSAVAAGRSFRDAIVALDAHGELSAVADSECVALAEYREPKVVQMQRLERLELLLAASLMHAADACVRIADTLAVLEERTPARSRNPPSGSAQTAAILGRRLRHEASHWERIVANRY